MEKVAFATATFALLLLVTAGTVAVGDVLASDTAADNRTAVTHDLSIGLSEVPADGEVRTVYVSVPDTLAATISVDGVAAGGGDITPVDARIVDGPDGDGIQETIALDVRATGGGTTAGQVSVTVRGSYPDVGRERAEQIAAEGVTGSVRYTVDESDFVIENIISQSNTTLDTVAVAESILAVSPPDGVVVTDLDVSLDIDGGPSSLSVPIVRLDDTEVEADVKRQSDRTRINLSVRNVRANEPVSMSMPEETGESDDEDIEIESLSMTATRNGNYNLSVSTGPEVSESIPESEIENAEPLGAFSIEHTWDNEALSNASITVRVNKSSVDRLESTDPDEVALYRYTETGVTEEPTRFIEETNGYYRYRVFTDGFSDWVTAGKQPDFRIVEAGLNTSSAVEVDDAVAVTVRIENSGGADGEYLTELWLNDVVVDEKELSIAAGGTGQTIFNRQLRQTGTYEVRVNNVTVDLIDVTSSDTQPDPASESGDDDGFPTTLIVGGVALALVVGGALFYVRRQG